MYNIIEGTTYVPHNTPDTLSGCDHDLPVSHPEHGCNCVPIFTQVHALPVESDKCVLLSHLTPSIWQLKNEILKGGH